MPIKKVDPKVDFIAQEHRILDFWKENDIFSKRVKANRGKPRWSFIDGPITANNPMGVHHAWGRTLKDIYQRYKAMTGHELRYQNGFDCQGLWVEIEVEKELGFTSKRDVEQFGIEKFVDLCKERVRKYSQVQTEQSIRLGYWMDWDNSYFTMSDENNYTIWMFLKKLFQEGKLYRGKDVVPWSGRSGTSYSQMEVIEGRKLVAHESVFVRFPLQDREKEYLLIWTTTPWTLSANVAAAVNVHMDYVRLRTPDGSLYYFAQDNLEFQRLEKQFQEQKLWVDGVPKLKTIAQIFKERGGYTVEGTVKGAEMVGWKYVGPFDELEAQTVVGGYPFTDPRLKSMELDAVSCHRVIDGGKDSMGNDVVVGGEGTGIVHIAPGCGDIDHRIGKEKDLVTIAPLDEEANYIKGFGWLTGSNATARETSQNIISDLKKKELLVDVEKYPHIYPHCWRSGDELVFRLVDEWYINMDWRARIKKIVDEVEWIPSWGQEREHEWLDNMSDWMVSKKRFWGLALPIWEFPDGSFYVVGSREELKELAVEGWEEFEGHSPHRPWIDRVKILHPKTGEIGTRIPDVGNPWLDAGIVPYSTLNYMEDRGYWEKWFPADFITENFSGQFRNWFYSLLAMSTVMEDRPPFKTLLGHSTVKDEHGKDMHKSAGNAIWFDDAAEKMGVDVMRWMYASQNVEHNLLFGYHTADEVRKSLITLWNVYSFFATYAAVDGYEPTVSEMRPEERTVLDRWIISKLNRLIVDARNALDEFRVDKFMRCLKKFLDDLSNWYIRRNRRRFWKAEDDLDKQTAYDTLYEVLATMTRLMAPVLPFIPEVIYQNLNRGIEPESVHLCDYPAGDDSKIDMDLMERVDALKKLVEQGRSARNRSNIKIRQPLSVLRFHVNDPELGSFIMDEQQVIMEELNVKAIEQVEEAGSIVSYTVKPDLAVVGQKYGRDLPSIREILENRPGQEWVQKLQEQGHIKVSIASGDIVLERGDLIVETRSIEGLTSVSDDQMAVGLVTELTPELVQEGIVRDLIRQVQMMRKSAGFAVEDRIRVFGKFHGEIGQAISTFEGYFRNETLTVAMENQFAPGEYNDVIKIRGQKIELGIERVI